MKTVVLNQKLIQGDETFEAGRVLDLPPLRAKRLVDSRCAAYFDPANPPTPTPDPEPELETAAARTGPPRAKTLR